MLPAAFSQLVTGTSIFQWATSLQFEQGIGTDTMSVPLTIIGEGYYWGAYTGVFIISIICALVFYWLRLGLNRTNGMVNAIFFVQIYRFVFVLPVASFPNLVSLATKDFCLSYLMAIIVFFIFGNRVATRCSPLLMRR